jgi:neutral amino acid transport system permease protein
MTDFSGGTQGLTGYGGAFRGLSPFDNSRFYDIAGVSFLGQTLWSICVGWTVVGLSLLLVFLLVRSPWGRVLKAIREDEEATAALGKNVFWYKLQSLALGAALGAIAGLFYAYQFSFFSPGDFEPLITFFAWTIVILGGTARVWAVPVGAIVFGLIFAGTRFFDFAPFTYFDAPERAYLRLVIIGLILIALMAFRPQGLLGRKEDLVFE